MKHSAALLCISGLLGSLILMALVVRQAPPVSSSVPPDSALATFELAKGFQIELLASEPLVADPVAMEIDEHGRMYVVEMHGYPLDKSGTGKIKRLLDTDGDGKMDASQLFAEGLMLPTGILRWKKGFLVTDAPHVLYLEDSDQDGRADIRDTLLTGFALSNPQHNLNNPLLGLDNWIYLGHESAVSTQSYPEEFGDRGSEIYYPGQPRGTRLPENARGRGVRIKPERFELEMLASNTQFGHTFDPWGRYFLVSNANHVIHQVLDARYLNRNPALLLSSATQSISDHGKAAEVFPITKNPQNQLLTDVGVFTSACGSTYYQGGLFPAPFDQVSFVAEPVSNVVHADVIQPDGASFTARRLYPNKEFLASTDAWFRPVNMYTGPDGALYVIDYYRQIIEHPEWMAEEVIASGALYNGTEQGRIYRITPKGTKAADWTGGLPAGKMSSAELVRKLAHPNLWWRRTAQRLLIDRQAIDQVESLRRVVKNSPAPYGRLQALWTLEGLGKLPAATLLLALKDTTPGVRENAVRLAESLLTTSPALLSALLSMVNDPDEKVRYQLLCSLGSVSTPEAAQAREALLLKDLKDPWVPIAALSASNVDAHGLLEKVLAGPHRNDPVFASLVERLSILVATEGTPEAIRSTLANVIQNAYSKEAWPIAVLDGLTHGAKQRSNNRSSPSLSDRESVLGVATQAPLAEVREAAIRWLCVHGLPVSGKRDAAMQMAILTAFETNQTPEIRAAAIHLLSLDKAVTEGASPEKLIAPHEPLSVQQAAMQALATLPDNRVFGQIISQWSTLTSELRNDAISLLMTSPGRVSILLDALEKGTIDPSAIGWPRTVGLMNHKNIPLRTRARGLLAQRSYGRQEVISAYEPALRLAGNWENGKQVYMQNCSVCHQINGKLGTPYGPDLGTIRNRRSESVMGDILNPNASIADGYDFWLIEKQSGETVEGLISEETPTTLTIKRYGEKEVILPRNAIKSIKAQGVSVMPSGFENQISTQDMADLLVFIKDRK